MTKACHSEVWKRPKKASCSAEHLVPLHDRLLLSSALCWVVP